MTDELKPNANFKQVKDWIKAADVSRLGREGAEKMGREDTCEGCGVIVPVGLLYRTDDDIELCFQCYQAVPITQAVGEPRAQSEPYSARKLFRPLPTRPFAAAHPGEEPADMKPSSTDPKGVMPSGADHRGTVLSAIAGVTHPAENTLAGEALAAHLSEETPEMNDEDYLNMELNPPVGARFHWRDGYYFQRTALGAVLITIPRGEVKVIPPNDWASIVASVSSLGETAERYADALRFHGEPSR